MEPKIHGKNDNVFQRIKPHKRNGVIDTISTLEELVQCSICLEQFTDPRMLPCQHTFCLSCLQTHLIASTGRKLLKCVPQEPPSIEKIKSMLKKIENIDILCPQCQKVTTVNKGLDGLENFPKNLYINSLTNLLADSSSNRTKFEETRCAKCQTLCNLQSKNCQHCKQVFCEICWAEHMDELKHNLNGLVKRLEHTQCSLEHKLDETLNRYDMLNKNIHEAVEERVEELRKKENVVLCQVEHLKNKSVESANRIRSHVVEIKNGIAQSDFETIENDNRKVLTFLQFHQDTAKILQDISTWGESRIAFDPLTIKLQEKTELFSKIDDDNKSDNMLTNIDASQNIDTIKEVYRSRQFTPKFVWSKCPRPTGVGVAPWAPNYLYVACSDSHNVLIMDRQTFKIISRLNPPEMLCPHGIAFSAQHSEIYVTDKWKHCIHVFLDSGEHINFLCAKGSGEGKLRSPEGIAVGPNNELVVCDTGNDRVVILERRTGVHLLTIGVKDKRTEFHMPTAVTVFKDKIIVADTGHNRIKMFSFDGKKLMEFGSFGTNRGQFQSAEAICCDPLGFVWVGDSGNARIQIYNHDGSLVRTFGGFGSANGKFASVTGVHITPEFQIIVSDGKNRRIQIF